MKTNQPTNDISHITFYIHFLYSTRAKFMYVIYHSTVPPVGNEKLITDFYYSFEKTTNEGAIWHSIATQWKVRGTRNVYLQVQAHGVTVCLWVRRARQGGGARQGAGGARQGGGGTSRWGGGLASSSSGLEGRIMGAFKHLVTQMLLVRSHSTSSYYYFDIIIINVDILHIFFFTFSIPCNYISMF
jgi:hypothetical protein